MGENLDPNWLGDEDEEVYRENIIDHYKNPRNFKELNPHTVKKREYNPLCGDDVTLFIDTDSRGKVKEASFKGNGCAISVAASSMFTDYIKGKTLDEVKNMKREEIFELLGIQLGVVRMKCGLLCLKAAVKGIQENEVNGSEVKK